MQAYEQWIEDAGKTYNVDPALLRLLVGQESGGNQGAISPKGAIGLGQLMPATAAELGVDPRDPQQNIQGAAKYLSQQLDKYGDVGLALAAYNAGPGAVDQAGGVPNFPETQNYVRSIMAKYQGGAAPAAAKAAPADPLDAEFDALFGTADPQMAAPDTLDAEFDALFAIPDQEAPKTPTAPVPAAPVQPGSSLGIPATSSDQNPLELAANTLLGQAGLLGTGIGQGYRDIGNSLAQGLLGATDALGISQGAQAERIARDNAQRRQYETDTAGQPLVGAGRLATNIATTAAPIAGVGGLLAKGGNRLLGALQSSPLLANAAARTGQFLSGQGGLLSRSVNSAGQGLTGAALLSGGSETPIAEQLKTGTAIGAAVPVVGATLARGAQGVRALVDPFTEAGQQRIAQNALRQMAEGGPTAPNLTEFVPGSRPTLAQATANPELASLENVARGRNVQPFAMQRAENNAARNVFWDSLRGNQQTLDDAIALREEQAIPLLDKALEGAKTANPANVVAKIDEIMAGPEGKRKAVVSALNEVKGNLRNAAGEVETDARMLYGVRKAINDQLETVAGRDNASAQLASRELLAVKGALDEAIDEAAPGFKDYLQQYANLSKPVTAQKYLQNLDLTDQTSQAITLQKVKGALKRIDRDRAASGANAAKNLSDEQVNGLRALQQDLQRQANEGLGKSRGSDTFQNLSQNNLLNAMLGQRLSMLPMAPEAIAGGVGGLIGGPVGAGVGVGGVRLLKSALAEQNPAIEAKLVDLLINADQGGSALSRAAVDPAARNLLLQRMGVNVGVPLNNRNPRPRTERLQ